jgi:hypothetical protein
MGYIYNTICEYYFITLLILHIQILQYHTYLAMNWFIVCTVLVNVLHCKKRIAIIPSPAGMLLTFFLQCIVLKLTLTLT